MPRAVRNRLKTLYDRVIFYTIKLPFVFIAAPIGFLFEGLITLPYIIMTEIDGRHIRKKSGCCAKNRLARFTMRNNLRR